MTEIGAAGRQAALLGEDKLADEAQQKMMDALVGFSRTFVDQSCWDQSFDDDLPYAVQRQNEILGTGIDAIPVPDGASRLRWIFTLSRAALSAAWVTGGYSGPWRRRDHRREVRRRA